VDAGFSRVYRLNKSIRNHSKEHFLSTTLDGTAQEHGELPMLYSDAMDVGQ